MSLPLRLLPFTLLAIVTIFAIFFSPLYVSRCLSLPSLPLRLSAIFWLAAFHCLPRSFRLIISSSFFFLRFRCRLFSGFFAMLFRFRHFIICQDAWLTDASQLPIHCRFAILVADFHYFSLFSFFATFAIATLLFHVFFAIIAKTLFDIATLATTLSLPLIEITLIHWLSFTLRFFRHTKIRHSLRRFRHTLISIPLSLLIRGIARGCLFSFRH